VYSSPSDAAASLSFQTAPPKPARPDPSQGNDSFGALVDSNLAADTGSDRTASTATQQPSHQGPADSSAPTAEASSRDPGPASQATSSNANDTAPTAQSAPDTNASTSANPGTEAVQGSPAKSSGSKADAAKPADKSRSEHKAAIDSTTAAQPGSLPLTTPNPVAVAITVAIAPTNVPAATPAAGGPTAPLAIAAAAIAASSQATAAAGAATVQTKLESDAAAATASTADAAVATSAATAATSAAAQATARIAAQVTAAQPSAAQARTLAATDAAAATTAVAATEPVLPKSNLPKPPIASQAKAGASAATDANAGAAPAASPTATPAGSADTTSPLQSTAAAKPEAGNGGEPAPASVDSLATSSSFTHDHAAVVQNSTGSADAGAQTTAAVQIPLSPATAIAAPVAPLTVTAATSAPVPLSGLALEIAASAQNGKSRFEIRLDPADLGRIDVRVDVDRNGQVTSHLTVEKPETLSMLQQDAPQLQRALDDAGLKTGNGGLQFSLRDQSSSGQNSDTGRQAQRLVINSEDTVPAVVAGRSYGRTLGSSSGVDIRV